MAYNAPPNMKGKYIQGRYVLKNPSKYCSNPDQIIYRSSLELKFCTFMDINPRVMKWGSEVVSIPYQGPDKDPKTHQFKNHTYHVDFYVEIEDARNPAEMERLLIEVKPYAEANAVINNIIPKKPEKSTPTSLRNWEYQMKEFLRNKYKWAYAQAYAKKRHMNFLIVTEKIINKFAG